MPALPRAQSMPRDLGLSGLGFSFLTTPFSTTAMREHLFTHMSQVDAISTRSGEAFREAVSPAEGDLQDSTCRIEAPTAPEVASLRNPRRFIIGLLLREMRRAIYLPQVSGCGESTAWL